MAGDVKVKVHPRGARAVRNADGVVGDLLARAERVAAMAGDGMEADVQRGSTRARATVRTATPDAMRAEADDLALTRALDAGR